MNNFFRGSQFTGRPGAAFAGAGARTSQVQAPAIPSGPNASGSGGIRCESGRAALTACPPPNVVPGVVMDERLALLSDEGQNSSNAQAVREHVEGKQYNGMAIESLIGAVSRAEQNAAEHNEQKKDGK